MEKVIPYFLVLYDPGKGDKEQKNHKNSLRIADGLHRLEIGTPRTCLCRTTEKELERKVLCIVVVKLRFIISLRVISLGFKIIDLCCEQKTADYFIPLSK